MKRTEEIVLLYQMSDEKVAKIKAALKPLKVRTKKISEEMTLQRVGYLAELHGFRAIKDTKAVEAFSREVMVFQVVNDKRLNEILLALQTNGIEASGLKAMVTPYNRFWTFAKLCQNLQQENELMAAGKTPSADE